jgi:hypothetical protein
MRVAVTLCLVSLITGCGRNNKEQEVLAGAPAVVRVGEENIVRVQYEEIVTGPLVSGFSTSWRDGLGCRPNSPHSDPPAAASP